MLSAKNEHSIDRHTPAHHLRIGLYVYVDLPWFRHPFTANAFKISSDKQIRELRALKKPSFRYDPDLSDDDLGDAEPALPLALVASGDEQSPPSGAGAQASTVVAAAADLMRDRQENRMSVERTEKSFMKAVSIMRRLDRSLALGSSVALDETKAMVDQMVTTFLDQPNVTLQVMGESCGGDEVYDHRLNVCVTSMMLAKGLKLGAEQTRLLGVGALLHDIGMKQAVFRGFDSRPADSAARERGLLARQIENSEKIGRQLALAPDALSVIAEHHELADGSGIPRGLTGEQIAPLARIVALVNFYDELCNPIDIAQGMTPHEALAHIFAQLQCKFDAQVLQVMIRSLGVYPPGSIVRLSNDALAIVVAVNPGKSLRPWVMLHDASVPKDKANIVNLETERTLSIRKSIRPALLPAATYAYLSPRKRITYFFDGGLLNAESPK